MLEPHHLNFAASMALRVLVPNIPLTPSKKRGWKLAQNLSASKSSTVPSVPVHFIG